MMMPIKSETVDLVAQINILFIYQRTGYISKRDIAIFCVILEIINIYVKSFLSISFLQNT